MVQTCLFCSCSLYTHTHFVFFAWDGCIWGTYWISVNLLSGGLTLLGGISTNLFLFRSIITLPSWRYGFFSQHIVHDIVSYQHFWATITVRLKFSVRDVYTTLAIVSTWPKWLLEIVSCLVRCVHRCNLITCLQMHSVSLIVWNRDVDCTHWWTPHVAALALQAFNALDAYSTSQKRRTSLIFHI